MFVQSFLLYGFAIVMLSLLLLLAVSLVMLIRENSARSALIKEFTLYKRDNEKKAAAELDNAKKRATEIIRNTQFFTDSLKTAAVSSIEESLKNGKNTYDHLLQTLGDKTASELIDFSNGIKNNVSEEAKKITNEMETEMQKEKEIAETAFLEKLQRQSVSLLSEVLKESVSNSLTEEEKEKIVLTSLDKIKKEYGFS